MSANQSSPTPQTASPINPESIKSQLLRLKSHLEEGKSINFFQARDKMGIGHLHSRISDLHNKNGMEFSKKKIRIGSISCLEYSLATISEPVIPAQTTMF